MKKLLYLLSVLVATSAFGADAANDFIFTQRKTDNSGNIQRNIPASGAATTAATFRSTLAIAGLTDDNTFTGTNTFSKAISVNDGTGKAGALLLAAGTTQSTTSSYITIQAPAAVTAYVRTLGGTVGSTGFPLYSVSGTTQTESLVAGTGTGNVVRSASPTLTGVPLINNATASNPAVITDTLFHVTAADTTQNLTLYDSFGAQGKLAFRVAAGTSASPSAVQVDTVMAEVNVRGYQTTGYAAASGANMLFVAHENFTDSAQGTYVRFQTCPDGTNTRVNAFSMYGDVNRSHLPLIAESTLSVTGHTTFEGVTSTGATGTGKLVYAGSPTLTTAALGSSTATTQSAGDNSTKLATTAYADRAARATNLGTFASPNTAAGAITWTSPVYNIYTSAASTRTYTLPAASSYTGQAFILNVAVGTGHVNVQPASGAQLVLAGVLLTANHYVQAATSAPGNYICFISDGTNWCSLGSSGTWADAASP